MLNNKTNSNNDELILMVFAIIGIAVMAGFIVYAFNFFFLLIWS